MIPVTSATTLREAPTKGEKATRYSAHRRQTHLPTELTESAIFPWPGKECEISPSLTHRSRIGPGGRGENGTGWGDRAEVTASVKVEASLDLSKLSTEELETLAKLLDRAAPQEAELVKSSVDNSVTR